MLVPWRISILSPVKAKHQLKFHFIFRSSRPGAAAKARAEPALKRGRRDSEARKPWGFGQLQRCRNGNK